MASIDPSDKQGRGCDIYLCYGHASDGFVGALDDADSMSEHEVQNYIRGSNPALYERLHEMPVNSTDVPLSLHAQRSFKKAREIEEAMAAHSTDLVTSRSSDHHTHEVADRTVEKETAENSSPRLATYPDNLAEQLKRYIHACLSNQHILVLKKHPLSCSPLQCKSPACPFGGLVHADTFYLILRPSYFGMNQTCLTGPINHMYYGLRCLEDVFHTDVDDGREKIDQVAETRLDGVGRSLIVKAARRLYQIGEKGARKENEVTTVLLDDNPENCHHAQSRMEKKSDIESTLIEVEKYEGKRASSQESTDDDTPDLCITRPYYMEAPRDRYKKQGLSRYDQRLASLEERKHKSLSPETSSVSGKSDHSVDRYCYCREPELEEEDIIKCSNDWCSIGWFHLRCTGLRGLPVIGEKFLCNYCKDDYGPFKPLVDKGPKRISDTSSAMTQESARQQNEYSTGEDSWAESSDCEHHGEEDVAIVIKSPQWGIPVNRQDASEVTEQKVSSLECQTFVAPECQSQLDGFTAINSPAKPTTTTATTSGSSSTIPQSAYPPPLPPPGSSAATFADLAPYIFSDGLSELESQVFETWKMRVTTGRAPGFRHSTSADDTGYRANDRDNGSIEGMHERSLSKLLARVQVPRF